VINGSQPAGDRYRAISSLLRAEIDPSSRECDSQRENLKIEIEVRDALRDESAASARLQLRLSTQNRFVDRHRITDRDRRVVYSER